MLSYPPPTPPKPNITDIFLKQSNKKQLSKSFEDWQNVSDNETELRIPAGNKTFQKVSDYHSESV